MSSTGYTNNTNTMALKRRRRKEKSRIVFLRSEKDKKLVELKGNMEKKEGIVNVCKKKRKGHSGNRTHDLLGVNESS